MAYAAACAFCTRTKKKCSWAPHWYRESDNKKVKIGGIHQPRWYLQTWLEEYKEAKKKGLNPKKKLPVEYEPAARVRLGMPKGWSKSFTLGNTTRLSGKAIKLGNIRVIRAARSRSQSIAPSEGNTIPFSDADTILPSDNDSDDEDYDDDNHSNDSDHSVNTTLTSGTVGSRRGRTFSRQSVPSAAGNSDRSASRRQMRRRPLQSSRSPSRVLSAGFERISPRFGGGKLLSYLQFQLLNVVLRWANTCLYSKHSDLFGAARQFTAASREPDLPRKGASYYDGSNGESTHPGCQSTYAVRRESSSFSGEARHCREYRR